MEGLRFLLEPKSKFLDAAQGPKYLPLQAQVICILLLNLYFFFKVIWVENEFCGVGIHKLFIFVKKVSENSGLVTCMTPARLRPC